MRLLNLMCLLGMGCFIATGGIAFYLLVEVWDKGWKAILIIAALIATGVILRGLACGKFKGE